MGFLPSHLPFCCFYALCNPYSPRCNSLFGIIWIYRRSSFFFLTTWTHFCSRKAVKREYVKLLYQLLCCGSHKSRDRYSDSLADYQILTSFSGKHQNMAVCIYFMSNRSAPICPIRRTALSIKIQTKQTYVSYQ